MFSQQQTDAVAIQQLVNLFDRVFKDFAHIQTGIDDLTKLSQQSIPLFGKSELFGLLFNFAFQ